MEDKEKRVGISISASPEARKGSYANLASVRTSKKENVLDFFFVDSEVEGEEGGRELVGVLQARIIMTDDSLIELKRMLDAHVEKNFKEAGQDGNRPV